jgi:putative transposase
LESFNLLIKDRRWFGNTSEWKELLKSNPKEIDLLRKHFRTGSPLGDEAFLLETEQITRRELIPKKPGRKRKKTY